MSLTIEELINRMSPRLYNSYYDLSKPVKELGAGNLLKEVEQALFSYRTINETFEGFTYRVKKMDSVQRKLKTFMELDEPAYYAFDDLIAFRHITNDTLPLINNKKVITKAVEHNGYRAVHYYFIKHNFCYPMEIQVVSQHDAIYNDWDSKYVYHKYDRVGTKLRDLYEKGIIKTEYDFVNALTELLRKV